MKPLFKPKVIIGAPGGGEIPSSFSQPPGTDNFSLVTAANFPNLSARVKALQEKTSQFKETSKTEAYLHSTPVSYHMALRPSECAGLPTDLPMRSRDQNSQLEARAPLVAEMPLLGTGGKKLGGITVEIHSDAAFIQAHGEPNFREESSPEWGELKRLTAAQDAVVSCIRQQAVLKEMKNNFRFKAEKTLVDSNGLVGSIDKIRDSEFIKTINLYFKPEFVARLESAFDSLPPNRELERVSLKMIVAEYACTFSNDAREALGRFVNSSSDEWINDPDFPSGQYSFLEDSVLGLTPASRALAWEIKWRKESVGPNLQLLLTKGNFLPADISSAVSATADGGVKIDLLGVGVGKVTLTLGMIKSAVEKLVNDTGCSVSVGQFANAKFEQSPLSAERARIVQSGGNLFPHLDFLAKNPDELTIEIYDPESKKKVEAAIAQKALVALLADPSKAGKSSLVRLFVRETSTRLKQWYLHRPEADLDDKNRGEQTVFLEVNTASWSSVAAGLEQALGLITAAQSAVRLGEHQAIYVLADQIHTLDKKFMSDQDNGRLLRVLEGLRDLAKLPPDDRPAFGVFLVGERMPRITNESGRLTGLDTSLAGDNRLTRIRVEFDPKRRIETGVKGAEGKIHTMVAQIASEIEAEILVNLGNARRAYGSDIDNTELSQHYHTLEQQEQALTQNTAMAEKALSDFIAETIMKNPQLLGGVQEDWFRVFATGQYATIADKVLGQVAEEMRVFIRTGKSALFERPGGRLDLAKDFRLRLTKQIGTYVAEEIAHAQEASSFKAADENVEVDLNDLTAFDGARTRSIQLETENAWLPEAAAGERVDESWLQEHLSPETVARIGLEGIKSLIAEYKQCEKYIETVRAAGRENIEQARDKLNKALEIGRKLGLEEEEY